MYRYAGRTINARAKEDKPPQRGERGASSRARGRGAQGYSVFVGGLAWATNDEALHDLFRVFGDLVECRVAMDAEGESRASPLQRCDSAGASASLRAAGAGAGTGTSSTRTAAARPTPC